MSDRPASTHVRVTMIITRTRVRTGVSYFQRERPRVDAGATDTQCRMRVSQHRREIRYLLLSLESRRVAADHSIDFLSADARRIRVASCRGLCSHRLGATAKSIGPVSALETSTSE